MRVSSQRRDTEVMTKRPTGLRITAWYLLALGLFMAGGASMTGDLVVLWVCMGVLAVTCAIGLLRDALWGWALGLILGLVAVAFSVYVMLVVGGDITEIGAYVGLLLFTLGPGVLLLCVLLNPRAISWFRSQHGRAPSIPPPPLPPSFRRPAS
jgi:hypothetical protein